MTTSSPHLSRRGLLGLGAAAAGALSLSACAGSGGGAEQQGGDAKQLQFWSNHPGSSKTIEQDLIKKFEAQSDGVKVTLIDAGKNYEEVAQKFNAALSGGNLPDIVVLSDVTWFNFAVNKQIAPLEELFEKAGVNPKDYVQPLYEDYEYKGQHYALPYSRSTPLFYYNKDLWAKAGLPDRGPTSWDEMKQWSPTITQKTGKKLALSTLNGANYLDWIFQGTVWSMGGMCSDGFTPTFTNPNTIKAAKFLQDYKNTGMFGVAQDPVPIFSSGQSAALIESTGSLKGILDATQGKFEVGTAFMPGPKGKACPTGGAGLAIPAGISDERKVNALKAIGFLTNTDSTSTFAEGTGYMPVRKDALEAPTMKAYLKRVPQAKTAIEQLPFTHPQDAARVFVPGGGRKIGGALDEILQGADPEKVLTALQAWMKPKMELIEKKAK